MEQKPARVGGILAAAAVIGLLFTLGLVVDHLAQGEERRACGCRLTEPCPPACYRHAWWWNFPA